MCPAGQEGEEKEISMTVEKRRNHGDVARTISAAAIAASVPSAVFVAGRSSDYDLVIASGRDVDLETGLIGTALGRRLRHLTRRRHVRRDRRTRG
jgi:hypothetical protein